MLRNSVSIFHLFDIFTKDLCQCYIAFPNDQYPVAPKVGPPFTSLL